MPKPKKKKKSPQPVITIIAVGLGLALFGYFAVYRPYVIHQERKQFEQAETYVSRLADQIQAKVGKANQVKQENYCQRAHLKTSRGPLSCVTATYLLYDGQDATASNALMMNIAAINKTPINEDLGDKGITQFSDSLGSGPQTFSQKITDNTGLDCSIGYTYRYLDGADSSLHPKDSNNLFIETSCLGWPISTLYPIHP